MVMAVRLEQMLPDGQADAGCASNTGAVRP